MQPRISACHTKITEETKDHIIRSCTKLEHYFDRILDCEVILDKEKHNDKVEIIVKVPQHTFTATAEADNLYKALAEAEAKVESQLKKHHDRLVSHH